MDTSLRLKQKAFRLIPAVTDWLASSDELKDRYRFLVLDEASGIGKTRLAANMTTAERFLLVDCASSTTPDLLDFVRGRHDVVLYDEAHVDMIIKKQKAFPERHRHCEAGFVSDQQLRLFSMDASGEANCVLERVGERVETFTGWRPGLDQQEFNIC